MAHLEIFFVLLAGSAQALFHHNLSSRAPPRAPTQQIDVWSLEVLHRLDVVLILRLGLVILIPRDGVNVECPPVIARCVIQASAVGNDATRHATLAKAAKHAVDKPIDAIKKRRTPRKHRNKGLWLERRCDFSVHISHPRSATLGVA